MDTETTNNLKASYDRIAPQYVEHIYGELAHKPLDRALLDRFADAVRSHGQVCDMGCGPGHVARYLHERGVDVLGMDLSPGMVAEARRLNPGIAFHEGSMLALDEADNAWAGIYIGSLGFATNQNWLDENPGVEPPRSWDDLLKPEFTGQIMVAHPSSSGTSYTAICTILQLKGEEEGWKFINDYAGQVLQFTKSGAAPAKFVGQGEAAVGIVFSHDIVAEIEKGSPLVLTFPEEGTGYEIGGMGIIKGAAHLDAAKKWFDWALEPATQELGPKYEAYQAPTVKGATPSRPELLEVNLIDYDFDYCGSNKTAFVDRFTNEVAAADNLKE